MESRRSSVWSAVTVSVCLGSVTRLSTSSWSSRPGGARPNAAQFSRLPCAVPQNVHSTRDARLSRNAGYALGSRGCTISARSGTCADEALCERTADAIRVVLRPSSVLIPRTGSGQLRRTGSSDLATAGLAIVEGFLTWRDGRGSVPPSIGRKVPGRWHQSGAGGNRTATRLIIARPGQSASGQFRADFGVTGSVRGRPPKSHIPRPTASSRVLRRSRRRLSDGHSR